MMKNSCTIELGDIINVLSELNWIDVYLFRLGTELGANDATAEEIAESLFRFFSFNDIGNRLASIKISLRDQIIKGSDIDPEVLAQLLEQKVEER